MEIDLPSLLVFRHLAKCGSFTATGKYWNISQPTVSQMVNRLEASTGMILLDRSGANNSLTADGITFMKRADEVCDAYTQFNDRINELSRRIDRKVAIAMDRSWYSSIAFDAQAQLKWPDGVKPIFTEVGSDWPEALDSGQADVVLACRFLHNGLSAGIQEALIRRERGITVAWNPKFHNFNTNEFRFPDILRTSVLIPHSNQFANLHESVQMWCKHAYGMLPANTVSFPSEAEAASAAAAGLGVLLTPGDAIPRLGLDGQGLTHLKIFDSLLPEALTLGVYCRSDETNRDVMQVAAQIGRLCMKLFPES